MEIRVVMKWYRKCKGRVTGHEVERTTRSECSSQLHWRASVPYIPTVLFFQFAALAPHPLHFLHVFAIDYINKFCPHVLCNILFIHIVIHNYANSSTFYVEENSNFAIFHLYLACFFDLSTLQSLFRQSIQTH